MEKRFVVVCDVEIKSVEEIILSLLLICVVLEKVVE